MDPERLARIVGRVGSYRDSEAALAAVVHGLVDDLAFAGAAVWRYQTEGPELVAAAGAPLEPERPGTKRWPLRADGRELGVLAATGTDDPDAHAIAGMLAGRCAWILADARQARFQRTLLEGLSHELRTPLQSLLGYLDLVREGRLGPLAPDQADALAKAARNAERILAVARDVLQVARIDAGQEQVVAEDLDLAELLAAEAETARPLADAAGLRLRVDCPAGLRVRSDGAKIRRVLTNLLTNALKYTDEGAVTVRAGRAGADVFVEVADTGPGIPPESREAVFDEYVRLDRARDGTGLGLAIARRLAELLGGRLAMESELGAGTTVRLELPGRSFCPGPD